MLPGMGIRREASTLGDGELRALRAAFARAYDIRDERGYGYFAGLHGLPLPNECPHNRPLFLPWHRAYLYLFERALQDLEPGANLPWWDWTTARSHREGLPVAYRRDPHGIAEEQRAPDREAGADPAERRPDPEQDQAGQREGTDEGVAFGMDRRDLRSNRMGDGHRRGKPSFNRTRCCGALYSAASGVTSGRLP